MTQKEAQDLRIDKNLSARVNNLFYDDKAKFHRVNITIYQAGEHGRSESANYYVHSEEEIFSQIMALGLATSNFVGKTHHYIVAKQTPGNVAQIQETSDGKSQTSQESNKETSSQGEKPVEQKSKGRGKSSKPANSVADTASVEGLPPATEASNEQDQLDAELAAAQKEIEEAQAKLEKAAKEREAAKAAKAAKATPYNRGDERHVDILTSFLNKLTGGETWKQNPQITQFSISLVGKDFVDGQGNIVPSFVENCKKFFKIGNSGL